MDYIKTIFSLKKVIHPFTPLKFFLWVVYCIIFLIISSFGGSILNLGHFHGIYYHSEKIWLTDIDVLVMVLFLSIDPLILVISIIFGTRSTKKIAQYKVPDHILSDETFRRKEFLSVAIIIACHKSNDVIERTVRAALDHFPPQNIYVADNGNSPVPLDDTEQIVLEIDPMINYRWSSMGNKTLAQFLSVNTIMERDDIKHVMIVDDDTKFPKNFKTYSEEIPSGELKRMEVKIVFGQSGKI